MTIIWAGLIYFLSTGIFGGRLSVWLLTELLQLLHAQVSAATFATLHFLLRKLAHLSEYAIFSLFLYYAVEGSKPHAWRLRRAFLAITMAGLYCLTDEFHQAFVPGRRASVVDCGIDVLGATTGIVVLYGFDRLFPAKSKSTTAESARMEEAAKGVAGE
jgi:VanZ family protein